MLETYFSAPKTLRRLRAGLSGPCIDGFAAALERRGYAHATAVRYLRVAAHLGVFLTRRRATLRALHGDTVTVFRQHLRRCRCPASNGGHTWYHARFGVRLFHQYLIAQGLSPRPSLAMDAPPVPAPITDFVTWFRLHRGVAAPTLRQYARGAAALFESLGPDVRAWTPQAVRRFLLDRAALGGAETTQKLLTAVRVFLRYLAVRGEARADLALAVPAIAHWRLASLPRGLCADELERLLTACEGERPARVRDRAMVLLLARLGLRAGDLVRLRLTDIDWMQGTVQVTGKGRCQVRLPLPQDVGDALLRYLACRPSVGETNHVFLRTIAPWAPMRSSDGVSSVVARGLAAGGYRRAPTRGAPPAAHRGDRHVAPGSPA